MQLISTASIAFLWVMVTSFHTMTLACKIMAAFAVPLLMELMGYSQRSISKGILNVEWTDLPSSRRVAAIPHEATVRATSFNERIVANYMRKKSKKSLFKPWTGTSLMCGGEHAHSHLQSIVWKSHNYIYMKIWLLFEELLCWRIGALPPQRGGGDRAALPSLPS